MGRLSPDDYRELIDELNGGYSPALESWTARAWLEHVREIFADVSVA